MQDECIVLQNALPLWSCTEAALNVMLFTSRSVPFIPDARHQLATQPSYEIATCFTFISISNPVITRRCRILSADWSGGDTGKSREVGGFTTLDRICGLCQPLVRAVTRFLTESQKEASERMM